MEYQEFCQIVSEGEQQNVILKLESNAFLNSKKDEAELIKDIVALANNKSAHNFIIIGVSSNGSFKSIENPSLNEENLKSLCRELITPVPQVKYTLLRWTTPDIPSNHRNKNFVLIEVDAEPNQCFRLNQDLVDYNEKYSYYKGEVWVRRDQSTDTASPEEIKELFSKKVTKQLNRSMNFSEASFPVILPYIMDVLQQLTTKMGGKLYKEEDSAVVKEGLSYTYHLVIPFKEKPLLLRVVPVVKCAEEGQLSLYHRIYQNYEHGLLLLSIGEVTDKAVKYCLSKNKEAWGWICTHEFWHTGLEERNLGMILPQKAVEAIGEPEALSIVFANITSEDKLKQYWLELIYTLSTRDSYTNAIENNRTRINAALNCFLNEGCPRIIKRNFTPKRLLANEVFEPDKYGNVLLSKQPDTYEFLVRVLKKMKI